MCRLGRPRGTGPRPVHTYSIVARDPVTGALGAAVQSHWFNVGPIVLWLEAGVGAIATQSFVEPAYGHRGLARLRSGETAPVVLAELVAADDQRDTRQVAIVDTAGRAAAHTGIGCISDAGHEIGESFSVQANMMANADVWPAMAGAYRTALADGRDLADRLIAALAAAESAGGDFRGRQSAAIKIVRGTASDRPWTDTTLDLRVDDHPDPVDELSRLVVLERAYQLMNAGDAAVADGDWDGALQAYATAAGRAPQVVELGFWHAVALVHAGRLGEARVVFSDVFARDPRWRDAIPRLIAAGQFPADHRTIDAVTGA